VAKIGPGPHNILDGGVEMYKKSVIAAVSFAAVCVSAPAGNAATVLTLEGGIVGIQHLIHFTPTQLGGELCKAPNHCQPVDYLAAPGDKFNELGADNVQAAVDGLPTDEQIVLFGHSQGGQVIYTDLRRWSEHPEIAPDPSRLTWVSIGNPANRYGGRRPAMVDGFSNWLPEDTDYQGYEVIRQYDGWADWPDDPSNLLAVANAFVGMFTIHTNYRQVDLNDPNNLRYTPDQPDGSPGNVTYIWAPTDYLPLAKLTGPLAPIVDNMLRPIVEKAYDRPVNIPDPTPPAASAAPPAAVPAAGPGAASVAAAGTAPAAAVTAAVSNERSESVAESQDSNRRSTKAATATKRVTASSSTGKSVGHHRAPDNRGSGSE
jgi:hypothetical protein